MALTKVRSGMRTLGSDEVTEANLADNAVSADKIVANSIPHAKMRSDSAIPASKLAGTLDLSSKTVTLPAASVTTHVQPTDTSVIENNIAQLAFRVASGDSITRFGMVDQVIDDFADATGVDTSTSTGENLNSGYYSGIVNGSATYSYTGADQTHTVAGGVTSLEVKLWGAGGASHSSSGGGGGGFVHGNLTVVAGNDYKIIVGESGKENNGAQSYSAGGRGGGNNRGGGGGRSAIRTSSGTDDLVTAGAGGGSGNSYGGGGGGTTGRNGAGYLSNGGGGTQSAGGSSHGSASGKYFAGHAHGYGSLNNSGGGGSGWYGGGSGGNRNDVHFGGGGGGSSYVTGLSSTTTNAQGNSGGDSSSGSDGDAGGMSDADYATGIGLGGRGSTSIAGGAGRIVLKWNIAGNMSLVSNTTTAEATPTTADIVINMEDAGSVATINTDIKAYISRDGGSNFSSAVTLVDEGDWGTNKRILVARGVSIGSLAGTTSMRYKIETLNQTLSKDTRIHAVSLAWKS